MKKSGGESRPGADTEVEVMQDIRERRPNDTVLDGPVSVRDSTGHLRNYDGAVVNKQGKGIGIEVKENSATKSRPQREFDSRLGESRDNVAKGVGEEQGCHNPSIS